MCVFLIGIGFVENSIDVHWTAGVALITTQAQADAIAAQDNLQVS